MIQMFLGIMDHGVGDVNQLAGGIGKALVCAATGMIVAVPALFFHRHFRARIDGYIVDMEHEAIQLMDVIDPRARRAAAAAGANVGGVAAPANPHRSEDRSTRMRIRDRRARTTPRSTSCR